MLKAPKWEEGGRTNPPSCQLAKAKARGEPPVLRSRAQQAWTQGVVHPGMQRCQVPRSVAAGASDGATPTTSEVIGDARHLCALLPGGLHTWRHDFGKSFFILKCGLCFVGVFRVFV